MTDQSMSPSPSTSKLIHDFDSIRDRVFALEAYQPVLKAFPNADYGELRFGINFPATLPYAMSDVKPALNFYAPGGDAEEMINDGITDGRHLEIMRNLPYIVRIGPEQFDDNVVKSEHWIYEDYKEAFENFEFQIPLKYLKPMILKAIRNRKRLADSLAPRKRLVKDKTTDKIYPYITGDYKQYSCTFCKLCPLPFPYKTPKGRKMACYDCLYKANLSLTQTYFATIEFFTFGKIGDGKNNCATSLVVKDDMVPDLDLLGNVYKRSTYCSECHSYEYRIKGVAHDCQPNKETILEANARAIDIPNRALEAVDVIPVLNEREFFIKRKEQRRLTPLYHLLDMQTQPIDKTNPMAIRTPPKPKTKASLKTYPSPIRISPSRLAKAISEAKEAAKRKKKHNRKDTKASTPTKGQSQNSSRFSSNASALSFDLPFVELPRLSRIDSPVTDNPTTDSIKTEDEENGANTLQDIPPDPNDSINKYSGNENELSNLLKFTAVPELELKALDFDTSEEEEEKGEIDKQEDEQLLTDEQAIQVLQEQLQKMTERNDKHIEQRNEVLKQKGELVEQNAKLSKALDDNYKWYEIVVKGMHKRIHGLSAQLENAGSALRALNVSPLLTPDRLMTLKGTLHNAQSNALDQFIAENLNNYYVRHPERNPFNPFQFQIRTTGPESSEADVSSAADSNDPNAASTDEPNTSADESRTSESRGKHRLSDLVRRKSKKQKTSGDIPV